MKEEKEIKKTNPYLHFLKLIIFDIVMIWVVGFCLISANWLISGSGAFSYFLPNLYAIFFVMIVWILASLLFLLRFNSFKAKPLRDTVKLKNYKLILYINAVLFIVFLVAILLTPM
jgi:hypothetical protein